MINLRVRIEKGNPGAVAIRMRGAEGTGVQDVDIELLEDTAVGLSGACGSDGSHFAVRVVGGRVGLDFSEAQPAPTIAGMSLIDQSEAAILYGGRQALTAVGCEIRSSRCQGTLIRTPAKTESPNGQISLLDSVLEFTAGQPARKTAIATCSSLYLQDVYMRGASTLVSRLKEDGAMQPCVLSPSPDRWVQVQRYALPRSVDKPVYHKPSENYYSSPVYLNGVRQRGELPAILRFASPPSDLVQRHICDRFPSLEGAVVVPAGSDSNAIQRAIDQHRGKVIFLPKGIYKISRTI